MGKKQKRRPVVYLLVYPGKNIAIFIHPGIQAQDAQPFQDKGGPEFFMVGGRGNFDKPQGVGQDAVRQGRLEPVGPLAQLGRLAPQGVEPPA
jgi:hypothetical protein